MSYLLLNEVSLIAWSWTLMTVAGLAPLTRLMTGCFLFAASFFAGIGVWIGGIRPYLSRHGGVVVTGATWALSAWADWQQCREFARAKADSRALALSRYFLLTQVGFVAGIILMLCGI